MALDKAKEAPHRYNYGKIKLQQLFQGKYLPLQFLKSGHNLPNQN